MTVQELIDSLEKMEDKSLPVHFDDEEWGVREVRKVEESRDYYHTSLVLLSN